MTSKKIASLIPHIRDLIFSAVFEHRWKFAAPNQQKTYLSFYILFTRLVVKQAYFRADSLTSLLFTLQIYNSQVQRGKTLRPLEAVSSIQMADYKRNTVRQDYRKACAYWKFPPKFY